MDNRQIREMLQYPDRELVEFAVHRANLSRSEWDLIKAREYDGETIERIAERLDVSDTTVKRKYASGMHKLDVCFSGLAWVNALSQYKQ